MRQLRLTAVSEDGEYLILSDGEQQFALRADERLHAAIRGDRARLGQLEIQLESQLRPRDIQARIRAGESVESVAAAATMPLEKVRRFASPVLAEREHIAGRARQATLRRIAGEGPVRTLESAAAEYAASVGAEPENLEWDAWKADDGRWRVRCSWPATDDDSESGAVFSFDPSGRSVAPQDAVSRQVAGEAPPEPAQEEEPPVGPPRLSVVADDHLDTDTAEHTEAEEAHHEPEPVAALVREADPDAGTVPETDLEDDPASQLEQVARRNRRAGRYGRPERRRRESDTWPEPPADDPATDRLRLSDIASHVEVEGPDEPPEQNLAPTAQEPPPVTKPRPPARGSSKSRRPSVPSWDEIMFGRRKND